MTAPPPTLTLGSVAVFGQLAASKRDILGPWVFDHDTAEAVSILEGLRARLGDGVRVTHADGAGIPARVVASMFDRMDPTVVNTPDDYDDEAAIAAAVDLAAASDVAIVVVGQRQNQIGENASSGTLDLPQAYQRARALTRKPFKFTVTGPHMLAKTLIDKDGERAVRVSYKPTLQKQIAESAFMQQRAAGISPDEIPEEDQMELVNLVWNAPESDVLTVGPVFEYPYNWLP